MEAKYSRVVACLQHVQALVCFAKTLAFEEEHSEVLSNVGYIDTKTSEKKLSF
jgi:hypothetical protein